MPGIERLDDRRRAQHRGGQRARLGLDEHDDHRRAGRGDRVEQRDLTALQVEGRGRADLSAQDDVVADDDDGVVGALAAARRPPRSARASIGPRAEDRRPGCPSGRPRRRDPGSRCRSSAPRAYVIVQSGRHDRAESVEHGLHGLARVTVRHPVDLAGRAGPVTEHDCGSSAFGPMTATGGSASGVARSPSFGRDRLDRQRAVVAQQHQRAPRQSRGSAGGAHRSRSPAPGARRSVSRGSSNRPSWNFTRRIRRTALSISRLGDQPARHRLLGGLEEARRGHDQVVARLDRHGGRLDQVGTDLLLPDHPADVVPVGDQQAGEAPLALAARR